MSKLNIGSRVRVADEWTGLYKDLLSKHPNDFVIESMDIWSDGTNVVSLKGINNFTFYGHRLEVKEKKVQEYVVKIGDMSFFLDYGEGEEIVHAQAEALADFYGEKIILYKLVPLRICSTVKTTFLSPLDVSL